MNQEKLLVLGWWEIFQKVYRDPEQGDEDMDLASVRNYVQVNK